MFMCARSTRAGLALASGFVLATLGAAASAQPVVNANVVNTPNVRVVNPSSAPVPVTLGPTALSVQLAQIPWSVDATPSSSGAGCSSNSCFIDFPPIPAGKMLVIQHVSATARPLGGAAIFEQLELVASNTQDPELGTRFSWGFSKIGNAGATVAADTYAAGGQVLGFVRPGSKARLTLMTRDGGATLAFTQGTISGYLVPAP
jgi:hypothetical protein